MPTSGKQYLSTSTEPNKRSFIMIIITPLTTVALWVKNEASCSPSIAAQHLNHFICTHWRPPLLPWLSAHQISTSGYRVRRTDNQIIGLHFVSSFWFQSSHLPTTAPTFGNGRWAPQWTTEIRYQNYLHSMRSTVHTHWSITDTCDRNMSCCAVP